MEDRRSFLNKAATASIAAAGPAVGTTRATVDVDQALETTSSSVPSAVDTKTASDHFKNSSVDRHATQGSQLSILEVYETDLYGWEARVGLTSCCVYFGVNNDGEAYPEDSLVRTRYRFTRSTNDFELPDPDEGYRGFEEAANTDGDPNLPGWIEPAFDTSVSAIAGLASSNPWTGVVAAFGLSANNIINSLHQNDGKKQLSDGFEVQHTHKEYAFPGDFHAVPTTTDEMEHYQRATLKMGDSPWDGHINVDASFSEDQSGPSNTSVTFEAHIGTCSDCGIVYGKQGSQTSDSQTRDIDISNPTKAQKEKFGIISVSDGQVADSDVRTTSKLSRRVQEIASSVEGREVTRVALNPPTLIRTKEGTSMSSAQ